MASSQPSPRPTPDPITRALAGWQPARVLMAANRLDIFTVLGDRYLSAGEIAHGCGTRPRSTRLLLNACVALGFLRKRGGRYGNSAEAQELLVKGKPAYLGDAIGHADHLYVAWGQLAEAVRTNRRVAVPPGVSDVPRVHRDFILAMHTRALRTGEALAESLDLAGRKQLFDAGGGPATYSIFLVRRYPGLRAIIFDLPPTVEIAREIIANSGLEDRISVRAGNYFQDDFGQGNDVVLLSAIFHSMAPRKCRLLLRKSYDSLVSGGIVAVHEGLIDPSGTSPVGAALFSLNMLVNTGEGRSYSGREIAGWMRETGFVDATVKPVPPPANTGLVIGTKP